MRARASTDEDDERGLTSCCYLLCCEQASRAAGLAAWDDEREAASTKEGDGYVLSARLLGSRCVLHTRRSQRSADHASGSAAVARQWPPASLVAA